MKFGIDLSEWQKGLDFDKVLNEGVEFAILRASYSTRIDKCFEDFYKSCKKRNIPVGCYLFSLAINETQAKEEARYLIELLKGKKFEYPIYFDIENKSQFGLGKKTVTDIIIAFCEEMEKHGYFVGVYSSLNYFNNYMDLDRIEPYSKWIAQYNTKCDYGRDFGMWQFGGEVNYIRSNNIAGKVVDQNYCYIDYPSIIKKGFNGYKGVKSNEDIAREVIAGKWGNGSIRKNKLISAGYDYDAIQSLVNQMLK